MLVLRLKKGNTVLIDGGIAITVLKLGDSKVSLGIVAPDGKIIRRLELENKVKGAVE